MRHDSHYVDELAAPSRAIGRKIAIDQLEANPEQPRNEFGDLSELTASIKEKGVLEPLLVKPVPDTGKWMIIAGERRWRASKLAGLTEVPCIEMDIDEQGVAQIALIENLQRKDLNVWEEADGLAALAEKFGYTQDQIAQKISKSRTTVTEFMTIAGLPPEIRDRTNQAKITSKATLLDIARQFDEAAMHQRLDELISGGRTAKRPKDLAPKPDKNGKAEPRSASGVPHDSNAFSFTDPDSKFELVIRFTDPSGLKRGSVLKALKTVFDEVKEDRVKV
jgi:ParB family chromosome partitioning protein